MASEQHKSLAMYIKDVHLTLRKNAITVGAEKAWTDHCRKKDVLETYAKSMRTLATKHWEQNASSETSSAFSRIKWVVEYCKYYFHGKNYMKYKEKEIIIANKINRNIEQEELFTEPLNLIDVGSCYNPFQEYILFNVLAIDLCPANESVLQCDFLNVSLGSILNVTENIVCQLQENVYEVVTFCFLLEYIPSSNLRIKACEKAYRLLKPGGLLLINTPDSKHVGANSKIMKCWRYTLAQLGFSRIKYEKYKHMHCMAFRKALIKETAVRWATLHEDKGLEYSINIPQDFNTDKDTEEPEAKRIKLADQTDNVSSL